MNNNNGPLLIFNALVLMTVLGVGVMLGPSVSESRAHIPSSSFTYQDTQTVVLYKKTSRSQYKDIERFLVVTPRANFHIKQTQHPWKGQQYGDIMIKNKSECSLKSCKMHIEITQLKESDIGNYRMDAYGDVESVKSLIPIDSFGKSVTEELRETSLENYLYCAFDDVVNPMGCHYFL